MTQGIKHTKQEIIDGIKEAWLKGIDVRTIKIQKTLYRWAYRSHKNHFENWNEALEAAGLKYEEIWLRAKQPEYENKKQLLLEEIRTAWKDKIDLSASSLQNSAKYRSLYDRAKTVFKKTGCFFWEKALEASGLPVREITRERIWNKDLVVVSLKERFKNGKPLNSLAVKQNNNPLYKAAINHFGTYEAALKASGFRPSVIRKFKIRPSREEIIKKIIQHHLRGKSLNATMIAKNNANGIRRCYWACRKEFPNGGWIEAVQKAGIDYEQYRKYRPRNYWDKAKVLEWIDNLDDQKVPLDLSSVSKNHPYLISAANRNFSGWYSAIDASGRNVSAIKLSGESLTSEKLIEKIKNFFLEGKDLSPTAMQDSEDRENRQIYTQSINRFGSWQKAISLAGINYPDVLRRNPKRILEEMIACIKKLADSGLSLNPNTFPPDSEQRLVYRSVMRRFDTWKSFLEFAKIDLANYNERFSWRNGEGVIKYLREKFETGVVTGASSDRNFAAAVRKYFRTVKASVKAAGMIYSHSGKISKQLLSETDSMGILYRFNQGFLRQIADKVYYLSAGRGFRSLDKEDLSSEAFLKFIELLPEKPPSLGIRQYTYWPIRNYLTKMNKNAFPEIVFGEEVYLDIFSEKDSPWE